MQRENIRVIVVGDSGVGKSCVIERFISDDFNPIPETKIGINFRKKIIQSRRKEISLMIWDTSTDQKFRNLNKEYYVNCAAYILIYDCSDICSFNSIESWLSEIRSVSTNGILFLVGNKCDISKKAVPYKKAQDLAKRNGMVFFEVSALTGENVEDVFLALADFFQESFIMHDRVENAVFKKTPKKRINPTLTPIPVLKENFFAAKFLKKCEAEGCENELAYRCYAKDCGAFLCKDHVKEHTEQGTDHFVAAENDLLYEENPENLKNLVNEQEEKLNEIEKSLNIMCEEICNKVKKKTAEMIGLIENKKQQIRQDMQNFSKEKRFLSKPVLPEFELSKFQFNEILNLIENLEFDQKLVLNYKTYYEADENFDFAKMSLQKPLSAEKSRNNLMTVTYKSFDSNNKLVALKRYLNLEQKDQYALIKFSNTLTDEAYTFRNSEYFLRIYGISFESEFSSIIFEPYKCNLVEYIHRNKKKGLKITNEKIKECINKIATACSSLMQLHIEYPNLNPYNIVITRSNEIKLLYTFRSYKSEEFKAPEGIQEDLAAEEKANVYALGLTLIFLATFEDPCELTSNNIGKEMRKILSNSDLPKKLKKIIEKMVKENPKKRPTFNEILEKELSKLS